MFKKTAFTATLILIVTAIPAVAMMGGNGAHGNDGCGHGNSMQGNMNDMMDGSMENNNHHYGRRDIVAPYASECVPHGDFYMVFNEPHQLKHPQKAKQTTANDGTKKSKQ